MINSVNFFKSMYILEVMNDILKIVLVGASTTGKTTIVNRMKYNTFNSAVSCTIGVSFSRLTRNNINYGIRLDRKDMLLYCQCISEILKS